MKTTRLHPKPRVGAGRVHAVIATLAVLSLTACGPRVDPTAPASSTAAPVGTPTALAAPTGQPVPPAPATAYTPGGAPPVRIAANDGLAPPPPTLQAVPQPQAPQMQPLPATTAGAVRAPDAPANRPAPAQQRAPVVALNRAGAIESIEPIRNRPQGSGAGAVIGGVLGAVVGNQFGSGHGRAAMTGVGAVGGALAGNNVERNYREGVVGYRVAVRLDDGRTRTFQRTQIGGLRVGDRVRVDGQSFRRV